MDTNSLAPAAAAATPASAHVGNRNLSTDPKECVPFLINRDNVI